VIALEGMAAASDPLEELMQQTSSPFTRGGVRQITQTYYSTVKKIVFLISLLLGSDKNLRYTAARTVDCA